MKTNNQNTEHPECNEMLLQGLSTISDQVGRLEKPPNRVIMTKHEVAELLQVTPRTLQSWRDKGILGYHKVGGTILYKESDVMEMLAKNYNKPFVS